MKKYLEKIVFIFLYCLFLPLSSIWIYINKRKRRVVGFASNRFCDNIKYLYDEMRKYEDIKVFFVTPLRDEVKRLASEKRNIEVFNTLDLRKILLYINTSVWVTTHGSYYIPIIYAVKSILRRLRLPFTFKHGSKWVILWHGIGFKMTYERIQKILKENDIMFITSELYRKYFKDIKIADKLKVTGYPRTDPLFKKSISKEKIRKSYGIPQNRKNILYAPTWGHKNLIWSRDEHFFKDLDTFCKHNNCSFFIRMHPNWYSSNSQEEKKLTRIIKGSKYIFDLHPAIYVETLPLLYLTDVLLTDWSSIANEFILLGKPIIFFDIPLPDKPSSTRILKPEDRIGYIVNSEQQLFKRLLESLHDPNLFNRKRKNFIKKIYEYQDGASSKRCAYEILTLLK